MRCICIYIKFNFNLH